MAATVSRILKEWWDEFGAIFYGAFIGTATFVICSMISITFFHETEGQFDVSPSMGLTVILCFAAGVYAGGRVAANSAGKRTVGVTSGVGVLLSLWVFIAFAVVDPSARWVPMAMLAAVFVFSYLSGRMLGDSEKESTPEAAAPH